MSRRSSVLPLKRFRWIQGSDQMQIYIDEDLDEALGEREAWDWLRRHDERVYSFVDATSFALMRRLRIAEALAFDGDFTAAGFLELRP